MRLGSAFAVKGTAWRGRDSVSEQRNFGGMLVFGLRGVGFVLYDVDAVGGMERQAARLAERLAARGLAVTVFSASFPTRLPRQPLREFRRGVEILRLPLLRIPPYDRFIPLDWCDRAFDAFVAAGVLRRPAIEVLYGIQSKSAPHVVHAGRLAGLATMVKLACSGPHGDLAQLPHDRRAAVMGSALHAVDSVVCLTEDVRREALAFGLAPERLDLVPNGVETAPSGLDGPLAPAWLAEAARQDLVLFVGRLAEQKGLDVLLAALAHLVPSAPSVRLACAGDGPLRAELEARARALGLAERVRFLGVRDDVLALLRAARAFVLPSRSEGLSNALLEAMVAGTPIVATDIPGNRAVVTHEREALLVAPDDPVALAAALRQLIGDPPLATRLARAARARVDADFDLERVADRYVAMFGALARGPREARPWRARAQLASCAAALGWEAIADAGARVGAAARGAVTGGVIRAKGLAGVGRPLLRRPRPSDEGA